MPELASTTEPVTRRRKKQQSTAPILDEKPTLQDDPPSSDLRSDQHRYEFPADEESHPAGLGKEKTEPAPAMEFFDHVRSIPETQWNVEKYEVFLYRIEPKVKNTDRPKYIGVYHTPITQEDIKTEHGGGVYKACPRHLKRIAGVTRSWRSRTAGEILAV